jgi:hypothetical protein
MEKQEINLNDLVKRMLERHYSNSQIKSAINKTFEKEGKQINDEKIEIAINQEEEKQKKTISELYNLYKKDKESFQKSEDNYCKDIAKIFIEEIEKLNQKNINKL